MRSGSQLKNENEPEELLHRCGVNRPLLFIRRCPRSANFKLDVQQFRLLCVSVERFGLVGSIGQVHQVTVR